MWVFVTGVFNETLSSWQLQYDTDFFAQGVVGTQYSADEGSGMRLLI